MKKIFTIFIAFYCLIQVAYSQKVIISGYLRDAGSSESLIGASIWDITTQNGSVANQYGFFSLTLSEGFHALTFSYIGYTSVTIEKYFKNDTVITISLVPSITLKGVEIVAGQAVSGIQSSRMSSINLPVAQMKKLPSFLGEADVLKAIQLLPGVQSGSEGTSGFYVRGGGADQNLILLDGVPVYNANHLFGFFSVFNPDAINNIELVKGGFPARYGGRLSSVLDIRMKEGNMKKFSVSGSIGLIASKLTIEGPIIKDKTSFIISARRTYLDILARPLISSIASDGQGSAGYYFADINAKINHIFSTKDRVFLSVYSGNDKFYNNLPDRQYLYKGIVYEQTEKAQLGWGNVTSSARWTHTFNGKLFSNTTLTYSNYRFRVKQDSKNIDFNDTAAFQTSATKDYYSGIRDIAGRYDIDFIPAPDHYIKGGIGLTYHNFSPGVMVDIVDGESTNANTPQNTNSNINAGEFFGYLEDDFLITKKMKVNGGLHFSSFALQNKTYFSVEPRFSGRYVVSDKVALKLSYSTMNQYIHLLTNSNIGLPTDLWVPATSVVPPLRSHQIAAGASFNLPLGLNFSVEAYYKSMKNVIEYKEGVSFLSNNSNWESKVESGKGNAFGVEFFLEKRLGNFNGWIGYTLAKSDRTFPTINNGEVFPYKFDRRHDISVVLNYKIDDHWDVSATWVYGTGNAITLSTVEFLGNNGDFEDIHLQSYNKRNGFRSAAYHRLDIGFNHSKVTKWGNRTWSFGLYNAYNRKNPFYYQITHDNQGQKALERVSLFPLIPSVSYSFKIGK